MLEPHASGRFENFASLDNQAVALNLLLTNILVLHHCIAVNLQMAGGVMRGVIPLCVKLGAAMREGGGSTKHILSSRSLTLRSWLAAN